MIEIDKGIPIPDNTSIFEFPVLEMGIGDSFFVPCEKTKEGKVRVKINNRIRSIMTKNELVRTHTVRLMEGGFRIWRLS